MLAGCTDDSTCVPVRRAAPASVSLGRGFVDLTAALEASAPFGVFAGGANRQPQPTVGAFADLDGDGRAEVVLARLPRRGADEAAPVARYRYDAGAGRLVADGALGPPTDALFVGLLDLDGDGRPDLVARDRGVGVAWGGAAGFAPAEPLADVPGEGEGLSTYPDDVDGDGWLDLLFVVPCNSARCQTLLPVLRVGARRFEARGDLVEPTRPSWPCAVLSAALAPDEPVIVQLTANNPDEPQPGMFFRPAARDGAGYPRFAAFDPVRADEPLTASTPMGAAAGDVDGDGLFDLVVSLDPRLTLLTGLAGWRMPQRPDAFTRVCSDGGASMIPWAMAFLDLDLDGRLDLVTTHGDDASSFADADRHIGPQRVTAQWNAGALRFLDFTDASGLGRRGNWRSLTVGDLDADGAPDLVVGGNGELPRVYRNAVDNGHHGFALRLRGSTSNHLGAGARVEVYPTETSAPQHYLAGGVGSPYVSSEPLVFAAIGERTAAARVEVRWPSGTVQRLENVAGGTLHEVVEPPLWAIEPPGRHLPADGRSEARVRVTPRRPDGSLDPDAVVDVRITHGPGRLAGPPVRDAAGWTAVVVAPGAPGSTRVEVSVAGLATPLRPRIWWD
ncbi:MAG: bepA 1 [Myxococcaceae bacterium]|nr:bepA 1 [Myxococcaceae bacterium]